MVIHHQMARAENIWKYTRDNCIHNEQVVFIYFGMYKHVYVFVYVGNNNLWRADEFERDHGEVYGMIFREERKEENNVIT